MSNTGLYGDGIDAPDGSGENHGVIGVVGVAPHSTMDFCRALYSLVRATKDWHYPRVIVDINTKAPSRGRHFQLGEADFAPALKESINTVASAGSDVVVVPCNTAHIRYSSWADSAPVPVPHIAEECVSTLAASGSRSVCVLGGTSLMKSGLYEQFLEEAGIRSIGVRPGGADCLRDLIESVKRHGEPSGSLLNRVSDVMERAIEQGADGIILGCTELASLTTMARRFAPHVVESNTELARAALRIAAPTTLRG